jgi:DNA-binding NarL/FixJ family response regulator
MIRIILVDDQALFRAGLRTMLVGQGFDVVAEAANGEEAVKLAAEMTPDVVLMDLRMPVLDGVEATRRIAKLSGAPRVIALTTFDDDEPVFEALRAGALGYLLKDTSSEKLAEAIALAARGESVLPPNIATKVIREFARLGTPPKRDAAAELGLSEREIAVLRELGRGSSNKEIGVALSIAEGTVKNHVTNIFTKLSVQDRTRAALKARELGLV